MKERIIEFLKAENKSSAQFAEEIGVQPSGISHIISGRNNPSLDFVIKMLNRYKYLSTDWLLFGKGSMYKDNSTVQSLFDQTLFDQKQEIPSSDSDDHGQTIQEPINYDKDDAEIGSPQKPAQQKRTVAERIAWFFSDGTFTEYYPRS